MFTKGLKIIMGGVVCIVLYGCPVDSTLEQLKFANRSDVKIKILVNVNYPDSSLKYSYIDSYYGPGEIGYLHNMDDFHSRPGLTLFVFEYGYFRKQWNDGSGRPDAYLAEDKILKKFVMTKAQLDSAGWSLAYP